MKEKIDETNQEKISGGYIHDKGLFSDPDTRFQVLNRFGDVVYQCSSKEKANKYAHLFYKDTPSNEITLEEGNEIIKNNRL